MVWCSRAAPLLLTHVNLLLFLYAGASLASAARLKWDPSTYIAVRALFPVEYRVTAVFLCAEGAVLLLLGHMCATALAIDAARARRVLLFLYAIGMASLVAGELAWSTWMGFRVAEFLRSERARQMAEATPLIEKLKDVFDHLGTFLPIFKAVRIFIKEAEEDAVRNVYVLGASVGLLSVLQPAAIVLALLAARAARLGAAAAGRRAYASRRQSRRWTMTTKTGSAESLVGRDVEKAPLRTAYKNGRIVIL